MSQHGRSDDRFGQSLSMHQAQSPGAGGTRAISHGLAPSAVASCVACIAGDLSSRCAGEGLSARVRSTTALSASAVPCAHVYYSETLTIELMPEPSGIDQVPASQYHCACSSA